MNKEDKIKRATEQWVNSFNAIPRDLIMDLHVYQPFKWTELTRPTQGSSVYLDQVFVNTDHGELWLDDVEGKILKVLGEDEYLIEIDYEDDCISVFSTYNEISVDFYDYLPVWGTMWSFGNNLDDYWLEDITNLQGMSNCGFRIFEHEDYGYFFGIDGAGYDFYECHWIPLYKLRGLQWHR